MPVYRNALHRFRAAGLFYGVLGFVFLPLQYLLTLLEDTERMGYGLVGVAECYNGFSAVFFTALSLIVPLVMACNLYGYMHNRRSVDVYHALPLTRAELYVAQAAAGITLLWGSLLINFGILAVASLAVPTAATGGILIEMVCWMVVTLVVFAITVFAAVQVGTLFDTVVFSLVLNGSLAAVYLLFVMLADGFLAGWADVFAVEMAYRLSPVSLMVGRLVLSPDDAQWIAENNIAMLLWALAGIVLLIVGCWLYGRRASEQAERVGNLGPLQIYVRAVGTLLAGNLLGVMFCGILNIQSRIALLFCIGIGSVIAYFVGDVVLTRSARSLPKALPAAVTTSLLVCLAVGGMLFGGFGFETRVPDPDQVQSVLLEDYRGGSPEGPACNVVLESPEGIALITGLHRTQVSRLRNEQEPYYRYGTSIEMTYHLKDGGKMKRSYYLGPDAMQEMVKVGMQPEVIRQSNAVFAIQAQDIRQAEVVNVLGDRREILMLTRTQCEELLEAVRADMLAQSVEGVTAYMQAKGYLTLEVPQKVLETPQPQRYSPMVETNMEANSTHIEVQLTERFVQTNALLESLGAGPALQNDWSAVTTAWVGVDRYLSWDGNEIARSRRANLSDIYSEMNERGDKYQNALNGYFVPLTLEELATLRPSLTSLKIRGEAAECIVAVRAGDSPDDEITGYFFTDYAALSAETQQSVGQAARQIFGDEWADAMKLEG
ncbi:MAG: hypothetical protein RR135_00125 [Oscillospiraceae bacterium]